MAVSIIHSSFEWTNSEIDWRRIMMAPFWTASSSASGSWGILRGVAIPVAPGVSASSAVSLIRPLSYLPRSSSVYCRRLTGKNDPSHLSLVVRMS